MNTTLGSVATTTCTAGYTRAGPATRTCQTDGSWSGAVNTCEPVSCGAAPDGTNSTATETSTTLGGTANYPAPLATWSVVATRAARAERMACGPAPRSAAHWATAALRWRLVATRAWRPPVAPTPATRPPTPATTVT
ncbi:MAG: hypothetical protein IPG81_23380 [Sandaracinaceae bacterium]|nr:hypothetical protein [Sandaracinaceae bacterium]